MIYLEDNRDYLAGEIEKIGGMSMAVPEGTYLAWIDCSGLGLDRSPYSFFFDEAKLVFNEGSTFGKNYGSYIRLNFGCPFETLRFAVEKIKKVTANL